MIVTGGFAPNIAGWTKPFGGTLATHAAAEAKRAGAGFDDAGAERFLARGEAALALEAPATEKLTRLLVDHITTATDHLAASTVFLNEWRYLSEDRRRIIQAKRDRYENIVRKIIEGREAQIRPCVGATYCLDRIYEAGEALCIHNAATSRGIATLCLKYGRKLQS